MNRGDLFKRGDNAGSRTEITLSKWFTQLIWLCIVPLLLLAAGLAVIHVRAEQAEFDQEAGYVAQNFAAAAIDQRLQARTEALKILALSSDLADAERWPALYQEAQGFVRSLGSHVILAEVGDPMRMVFNTRLPFGSALPQLPRPAGVSAAALAVVTGKPAVGDLFMGPIADEPMVAIAVPVLRKDTVAFVLLTTVESQRFQERIDQVKLPDGWSMAILDSRGEVIARRGAPEATAESDRTPGFRFVAKTTLAPWTVVLEIPQAVYRAPLFSAIASLLACLLGATLVGLLGGKAASRRLGRAVAALAAAPAPDAPLSNIREIAAVRQRLDAAEIRRAIDTAALRESETRFAATFEQAAVGIAQVAPDGRWLRVNRKLCEIVGYSQDELLAKTFQGISHPDDLNTDLEQVRRMLAREIEFYWMEKRYIRKDGSIVWVRLTVALIWIPDGRPDYFISVVEDIQVRKEAEAARIESETTYRSLFDNMLNGLAHCRMVFDNGEPRDFVYLDVNGAFTTQTGLKDVVGRRVTEVMPGIHEHDPELFASCARVAMTGQPERFETYVNSLGMWFSISVFSPRREHFVVEFDVITERKQAEVALHQSKAQLHALAARLQAVREDERTRIAREVHDELGQLLTGLTMDMVWLQKRLPQVGDPDLRQAMGDKLAGVGQMTDTMIRTVQEIASDLRPSILDNLGLASALRFEAGRFQQRTGLACTVDLPAEAPKLETERSTEVFRIFQEILTNVARHARAGQVSIRLAETAAGSILEVRDDGRGITPEQEADPRSLGLLGMRERAARIGGEIDVHGEPGRGTTVTVRVPT